MAKIGGNLVKKGLDKLSNQAKGKLGETITKIKYGAQGYVRNSESLMQVLLFFIEFQARKNPRNTIIPIIKDHKNIN